MYKHLSAALALVASGAALSQSQSQIVTSPTLIPDTNHDGKITLVAYATRVTPKVPRNTLVYGPCNDVAPYQYSKATPCPVAVPVPPVVTPPVVVPLPVVVPPVVVPPVVTPPVVTPPAADVEIVEAGPETQARNDHVTVGINGRGIFNGTVSLPVGWRRTYYSGEGIRQTAGFTVDGVEYVQQDAPLQGALVRQGSVSNRQTSTATGTGVLTGTNAGLTWTGGNASLQIQQKTRLAGRRMYLAITLTNTGTAQITRYDWFANLAPTANLSKMEVTAKSVKQADVSITSSDPRAIFYITPVIDPRPATVLPTKTIVSATKALDRSAGIGFLLNIAPGTSDTVTFDVGR